MGTTRASTILDLADGPSILRQGDVGAEEIAEQIGVDPAELRD